MISQDSHLYDQFFLVSYGKTFGDSLNHYHLIKKVKYILFINVITILPQTSKKITLGIS